MKISDDNRPSEFIKKYINMNNKHNPVSYSYIGEYGSTTKVDKFSLKPGNIVFSKMDNVYLLCISNDNNSTAWIPLHERKINLNEGE